MNRSRLALVAALVLVAGIVAVLALGGVGENLVYYWSPSELQAQGSAAKGATIRLGGLVEEGSVNRHEDGLTLSFRVTDGAASVPVVTQSVPPAMFRENIGVVVEGRVGEDGSFQTDRLMVKHDNQYQAPEGMGGSSVEELSRTLEDEI